MKKFIENIKLEGENLKDKTRDELNLKIQKILKRKVNESLDNLIVEWFALTKEISFREIGLKHFDTQLMAGLLLHQGKIVEMKTGEGKTLASSLPVALNALNKKGVHVVTVNDYLAERDQKWMGKIYKALGFTVGLIKNGSDILEKKQNYNADITYITNSELVFDYLRDNSAYNCNEIVQRPLDYCIIDEIDSILIDEARTPLILSMPKGESNINKLFTAKFIANGLIEKLHFQIDEKKRDINLTEEGYKEVSLKLGKKSLYELEDSWALEILNALKAKYIFKLNKDYIVLNNKIAIVDEFTGRVMEDRRWSLGIHEAVEMKEKVEVGGGTKTKSSITYQNFFTLYPKLAGMTGTAKTTEKEFKDIYNLDVIVVPTEKPMARKDLSDFVYQTELSKWKAVLNTAKTCFEKGQPLLIGTASVEKSEFLSDLFKISNLPHQVLNAKPENVLRESEIIAQAGKSNAITIATNMAGRGTDIILGGNPMFTVKQKIEEFLLEKNKIDKNDLNEKSEKKGIIEEIYNEYSEFSILENDIKTLPFSLETCKESLKKFYNVLYKEIYPLWEKENLKVKEVGGLFVLGTERHETRRIDNQLRGRSGRQGDIGISQFFVSLEDELIKVFGGDSIKRWVDYLIQEKDVPLESDLLTKSLENAQQKVELYNYDVRKNVFQYDDILNNQRKQLFRSRNEILTENFFNDLILRYAENLLDDELKNKKQVNASFESFWDLEKCFDTYFLDFKKASMISKKQGYQEVWISLDLRLAQSNFYEISFLKKNRTTTLLSIIDFYWTEHLERMSYIRETINWRSYGQQNPLIEYNNEAVKSFHLMFEQIRGCMLYYSLNNPIN
jgi:preprotein translocase subunit SecA